MGWKFYVVVWHVKSGEKLKSGEKPPVEVNMADSISLMRGLVPISLYSNCILKIASYKATSKWLDQGRITGIFFWGGKVIFPDFFPVVKCFFPVENSHFGRPKNKFSPFFKSEKQKKNTKKAKTKKKVLSSFCNFSTFLFPIFHLPFYNFSSFLLNFHPFSLFSLPLFSRYVSKNFPVRSLPPPACYATGIDRLLKFWNNSGVMILQIFNITNNTQIWKIWSCTFYG